MTNQLVARMCLLFGEPDTHDAGAWFAEMDRLVSGYSHRELDRAADIVLRSYRGKMFPPVSVLLTACEEARGELTPRKIRHDPGHDEWSKDRLARADQIIQSPMGRKAAEDGWIFALHSFAREQGRLPGQHEIGQVKLVAMRFDEAFRDVSDGRGGLFGEALSRLGASMLERREQLASIARGDRP